eukprot:gene14008-18550_t
MDYTRKLLSAVPSLVPRAPRAEAGFNPVVLEANDLGKVYRERSFFGKAREVAAAQDVLHYGQRGQGLRLEEGMVFTIEPMINAGKRDTQELADGWTVVTRDRSLSAQWEHMVAVTAQGFEVLTPWPEGTGGYAPI